MIRAIAAVDEKLGIAASNHAPRHIPWTIPEDVRYFRQMIEDGTLLMGRETYDTLHGPLPGRRNLVASRTLQTLRPGFELVTDVDMFLQQTKEDVWIIGGAGLYASTLTMTDEVYLTHIQGDFGCDRFFPEFADQFTCTQQSDWLQSGDYTYRFAVYTKNR